MKLDQPKKRLYVVRRRKLNGPENKEIRPAIMPVDNRDGEKGRNAARKPQIRIIRNKNAVIQDSYPKTIRLVLKDRGTNPPSGRKNGHTDSPVLEVAFIKAQPYCQGASAGSTGLHKVRRLIIKNISGDKGQPRLIRIVPKTAALETESRLRQEPVMIAAVRDGQEKKGRSLATPVIPGELELLGKKPNRTPAKTDLRVAGTEGKADTEARLTGKVESEKKTDPAATEKEIDLPEEPRERSKKIPDRWSECGQIFYTGGKAFGISSNLRTICIGTPSDVDSFFQTGKPEGDLNFLQLDTLKKIKEIRLLERRRAKEAAKAQEVPEKTSSSRIQSGERWRRRRLARPWSSRRVKRAARR